MEDSRNGILHLLVYHFMAVDHFWGKNEHNNHTPMDFHVSWG